MVPGDVDGLRAAQRRMHSERLPSPRRVPFFIGESERAGVGEVDVERRRRDRYSQSYAVPPSSSACRTTR